MFEKELAILRKQDPYDRYGRKKYEGGGMSRGKSYGALSGGDSQIPPPSQFNSNTSNNP